MPRQNLLALLVITVVSLVCYRQADSAHRSERGRMFDTFSEVLNQIDNHYVRKVEQRPLFEGALQGMVGKLDPYSQYIGPESYTDFVATLEQKYGGIGIELEPATAVLTVSTPLADSPAYEQGIRAGDVILEINGESSQGLSREDAIKKLKGKTGTVQLKVLHKGETAPVDIAIGRAIIPMPSVLGESRDGDNHWNFFLTDADRIGYVRITSFGEHTSDEVASALEWLAARGARGLILDMRNNPGGVFDEAVKTCDLLLGSGRIVSTQGRDGVEIATWDASGKAPYASLPLVVLVNQTTASAAEIVAACLQDHQRAIVVGQRTWGKGTVQNVIYLEGGRSVLKLTTASYWRPNGQNIHREPNDKDQETWGVQPDEGYEVKLSEQESKELAVERHRRDGIGVDTASETADATEKRADDRQLARAREALNGKLPP